MAAMGDYGARRRLTPSDRNAEYFNLFGVQPIEGPQNQTLRRKPSTFDLTGETRGFKSSFSQLRSGEPYKDNFDGIHIPSLNCNHGPDFGYGSNSSPIYYPASNTFFSSGGVMPREKDATGPLQKPISRPVSRFFANDRASITENPTFIDEKPSSSTIKQFSGGNIWNDCGETESQYSHKKENRLSLPVITIQPEWPLLRNKTGLAKVNRSLEGHRRDAGVDDKAFIDSLFPGGVDTFMHQSLQKSSPGNHAKPQFLLTPPPSFSTAFVGDSAPLEVQYPTSMKVMSGKQLIEDLDDYEHKENIKAKRLSAQSFYAYEHKEHIKAKRLSAPSFHEHVGGNLNPDSLHDQLDINSNHTLLDQFNQSLRDQLDRNTSTQNLFNRQKRLSGVQSLCDQFSRHSSTPSMLDLPDRSVSAHSVQEQLERVSISQDSHAHLIRKNSAPALRAQIEENPVHKSIDLDLRPIFRTHDSDGRKNKGFRRGNEALQVAINEKWACMDHVLNAPLEPIQRGSRFFVIKSNCELDIFASLKHGIWTSTDLGNKRLDRSFCDPARTGQIFLFFSVSGSGRFCGLAEMTSAVDHLVHTGIWSDKRWRGRFSVKWLNVKDIPNSALRQFRVTNNDNKPFTNCRDTQEILTNPGENVYNIFSRYVSASSVFQSSYEEQKYIHDNDEERKLSNDELHLI